MSIEQQVCPHCHVLRGEDGCCMTGFNTELARMVDSTKDFAKKMSQQSRRHALLMLPLTLMVGALNLAMVFIAWRTGNRVIAAFDVGLFGMMALNAWFSIKMLKRTDAP